MKSINKHSLFIFIFLCFFNAMHACENNCAKPFVSHIITNDEGVLLQVGTDWIVTEDLYATEEGIFVLLNDEWIPIAEALNHPECLRATWKCKCGYINYDCISACGVCGRPKPKKHE